MKQQLFLVWVEGQLDRYLSLLITVGLQRNNDRKNRDKPNSSCRMLCNTEPSLSPTYFFAVAPGFWMHSHNSCSSTSFSNHHKKSLRLVYLDKHFGTKLQLKTTSTVLLFFDTVLIICDFYYYESFLYTFSVHQNINVWKQNCRFRLQSQKAIAQIGQKHVCNQMCSEYFINSLLQPRLNKPGGFKCIFSPDLQYYIL